MTDHPISSAPGILVVDDDQMLLGLLRNVFGRQGFEVWTSPSGHTAMDLYRRHLQQIDVALLDVCMPGMDGPRTLTELRRINPGLKACFMSGHTGAYSLDDLTAMGAMRFFEKPFQIKPLAEEMWHLARSEVRRCA